MVFGGDAAAEPFQVNGKEVTLGVTAVVNFKEQQVMIFVWTAEVVEAITTFFLAWGIPSSRAHVGIIAVFEAYAMVMATYGWGRYLSNATLLDLQDNANAQSWITKQKGGNYAAGLMLFASSRRWEGRLCIGRSERVDTDDNTIPDALSRLFRAWNASQEAYKVYEFVTRFMPGSLVVQDSTIMVEMMKGVARILELGGHDCPATEEEYGALQRICDEGQIS